MSLAGTGAGIGPLSEVSREGAGPPLIAPNADARAKRSAGAPEAVVPPMGAIGCADAGWLIVVPESEISIVMRVIVFPPITLRAQYGVSSLEGDWVASRVGHSDPVGDMRGVGPLHSYRPLHFRNARVHCCRHHVPDHMPGSWPVESEPALRPVSRKRSCKLHARPHGRTPFLLVATQNRESSFEVDYRSGKVLY